MRRATEQLQEGSASSAVQTARDLKFISHGFSSLSPLLRRILVLCVALSECGFTGVRHLDPLRVRRRVGVVVVVPVPPLVWRALGVTLRRVLPGLLTAERRDIEVAPG